MIFQGIYIKYPILPSALSCDIAIIIFIQCTLSQKTYINETITLLNNYY